MSRVALRAGSEKRPPVSALVALLKPITWFAPMWAFGCGVVSSGVSVSERWLEIVAGIALAGPLVCGTSQVVNDWYDREVDAINEPDRPIPSGRVPVATAFYFALVWTALSLFVGSLLGPWVAGAALVAMALAWAYSAPPFRLKRNGWLGNTAVAACYEGLPWFTGAAIMTATLPDWRILIVAVLYSAGAHGIMTLNDFKSVRGDRRMGIRSLPVLLGVEKSARLACSAMAVPQVAVVLLLLSWGQGIHAALVGLLLLVQLGLMARLLKAPRRLAPWYNATGTTLYVLGMLVTAFALMATAGTSL